MSASFARRELPQDLIYPRDAFAQDFRGTVEFGESVFADAHVAVVGLARNCEPHLAANLARLEQLVRGCGRWQLHIETNDNKDGTDQVLADFCGCHRQATFTSQRLGREQFTAEFAGRRTQALAEYRTACQRWVQECASDSQFVLVIDFDAWGGWSHVGVMHGVGALQTTSDAAGMASVSLIEYPQLRMNSDGTASTAPGWTHYDAWALRLNSAFDDYTAGIGGWKHSWIPPVGSPPIPVVSAFGGMAVYETRAYLKGRYDGTDCEHVPFHVSMAEATGCRMYLDPAMRAIMHWMEPQHGRRDGDD